MGKKINQGAATFSVTDRYTVKTGRRKAANEGWAYSGTLHRNGTAIATFVEHGDGGMMSVQWADSDAKRVPYINTATAWNVLHTTQGTPEEVALRNWYFNALPDEGGYYEAGFAIESLVDRAIVEASLKKDLDKHVLMIAPGDVRDGGPSTMYAVKARGDDLALQVQRENPGMVVLNLLPFDAATAMFMTLNIV